MSTLEPDPHMMQFIIKGMLVLARQELSDAETRVRQLVEMAENHNENDWVEESLVDDDNPSK